MTELFHKCGGYRRLDSYTVASIIQLGKVNMMDKQMEKLGAQFREEGGFHERMTAVRVEARREQQKPVSEDAPVCPKCGEPMRLRHGASGDFWGCTAYPTCKGTREIST